MRKREKHSWPVYTSQKTALRIHPIIYLYFSSCPTEIMGCQTSTTSPKLSWKLSRLVEIWTSNLYIFFFESLRGQAGSFSSVTKLFSSNAFKAMPSGAASWVWDPKLDENLQWLCLCGKQKETLAWQIDHWEMPTTSCCPVSPPEDVNAQSGATRDLWHSWKYHHLCQNYCQRQVYRIPQEWIDSKGWHREHNWYCGLWCHHLYNALAFSRSLIDFTCPPGAKTVLGNCNFAKWS